MRGGGSARDHQSLSRPSALIAMTLVEAALDRVAARRYLWRTERRHRVVAANAVAVV